MRKNLNNIQWCTGCGNYFILSSIRGTISDLKIPTKDIVIISGIGCGSKMSQYINGYGIETLHGRTLPFATGVKLANPKLTVIVISGDGDGYGIGLGHFLHTCRKNIDLTYIVCDNENYALTTGQASVTTPKGRITKSTPLGNPLEPFHINELAKNAGCHYSYNIEDQKIKELKEIIKGGVLFPGFAHINVKQKCKLVK